MKKKEPQFKIIELASNKWVTTVEGKGAADRALMDLMRANPKKKYFTKMV